jgi:hypothetical protein
MQFWELFIVSFVHPFERCGNFELFSLTRLKKKKKDKIAFIVGI